jgi:hypothetical protein
VGDRALALPLRRQIRSDFRGRDWDSRKPDADTVEWNDCLCCVPPEGNLPARWIVAEVDLAPRLAAQHADQTPVAPPAPTRAQRRAAQDELLCNIHCTYPLNYSLILIYWSKGGEKWLKTAA